MTEHGETSWPKAIAGIVFLVTIIGFGTVHAMPPGRANKFLAAIGLPPAAIILDNLKALQHERGDSLD